MDNWDDRDKTEKQARAMGYDGNTLSIIDPKKFQDGKDGACHTDAERKLFWTDVLKSLTLDFETLATFAINNNPPPKDPWGDHIPNLKKKINILREKLDDPETNFGNISTIKCKHNWEWNKLSSGESDLMHKICTKCGDIVSRPFTIKL